MLDNKTLASRIQEAIEGSPHSQAAIAAAFGITEQAVSGWIRTGKFDKRKAPKLAKLTGRPVEFFLQESYPASTTNDPSHGSSQLGRPDPETLASAMEFLELVSQRQIVPIDFSTDAEALLHAYDLIAQDPAGFDREQAIGQMVEWLRARRQGNAKVDKGDVDRPRGRGLRKG